MKKSKEELAADAVLDRPLKVVVPGMTLSISPLKLGTLVYISRKIPKVGHPDNPDHAIQILGHAKDSVKHLALMVAYAILNSKAKITLFSGIYSKYLLWKLTPKDFKIIIEAILTQSQAGDFFLCSALIKQMNVMVSKADTLKETKQSGAPSQESQKTSD